MLQDKVIAHRQVSSGLGAVKLQLQGVVPPIEGCNSLRPDGGDVVSLVKLPVKRKDSVEVQSQTAAVIQHHSQLLPL